MFRIKPAYDEKAEHQILPMLRFEICCDQTLLLVHLVVSAALRTCLSVERTLLCTWLRTCLCSLRHIL